ncbi:aminotransferase-like domain-containing protein [Filimonas effusa]|uniref:PLP-dependent aminotransferase family protein n=1 Tax=Filimonas effusa TaxID=2508721 RepID=A0A4Q1DCF1_9BACT|nr:PLP-dependent aminotransferase family protein [Filimonas effusa]RXK86209.1 PLP-dependent aminotransferase family protein [Filimonas effusa]
MGSPVEVPYLSFILLDRESATAVYMQIAHQVINAIQRGYLPKATKLPGSRVLSELLKVHRRTVVAAYEELEAQGWVQSRPNQGTFVVGVEEGKAQRIASPVKAALNGYPVKTGFSFKQSNLLDNPFEHATCEYVFNDGIPDIRLTQTDLLSRLYSSNLKRKSNYRKMGYYNRDGSEFLKENLSHYLNLSRGLHISKNNLLITRSTEMSVYIISEILLEPGDTVVVADLSYFSVNMIFQKAGAKICSIPMDEEGIDVQALEQLCRQQPIRMLYLTPHHHYPTTITLSAGRRIEVLRLASLFGFIVLEDDYDFDFRYDKKPVLPMASADTSGMVVYVGAFGKSLAPGFRTGFIVAPENLMAEMRKYLGIIDRQGDILVEQVLAEMIREGEIHRHLKKSVLVYKERRDNFALLLQEHFSEQLSFKLPAGGLAIWAQWKEPVNLLKLSQESARKGLFVPRTLLYQQKNLTAMRLGFGHLNQEEMTKSILLLKNCVESLR